jgi:hypothetical protein
VLKIGESLDFFAWFCNFFVGKICSLGCSGWFCEIHIWVLALVFNGIQFHFALLVIELKFVYPLLIL